MPILEDFYLGTLRPCEGKYNPESRANRLSTVCEELCSDLITYLPKEKHEILKQLSYSYIDMSFENGKDNYIDGFITGMQFALACFYETR